MIPNSLRHTDIFLLDQILKDRLDSSYKILDAGCGHGRNLHWFYEQQYDIYGIDINSDAIELCKQSFPNKTTNFLTAELANIPFKTEHFDYIICNAVLHFAKNREHFHQMFTELLRVLKPGGTLFIRLASLIGLKQYQHISDDIYTTPDGSTWLLFAEEDITALIQQYDLNKIEPVKTSVVENLRCMTTLVLQKKKID